MLVLNHPVSVLSISDSTLIICESDSIETSAEALTLSDEVTFVSMFF